MKCEYGYCLNCEKEIVPSCAGCNGRQKPNEHYTEIELSWSNGSRMKTAVCIDCAHGPIWAADKQELTQAVWDAWDKSSQTYDKEVVIV